LGPNGAGKSTTMNIITGYLSATAGDVFVDGTNILEEPEKVKRRIGYLPENPPIYPEMTVREYLRFVCKIKHVPRNEINDRIERGLHTVGIVEV
ncbi:MAG: ATP-binding cassette domain-containing protein, partial [Spirochaetales bacterium]